MRTTNLTAIASARPVNRDASRARDMKGEHYRVPIPPGLAHFKTPPPAQQRNGVPPRGAPDLTNLKIGRLHVLRYHGSTPAGRNTWLVRCRCGDYELRRGDALVQTTDPDECCYVCKHTRRLQDMASTPSTPEARASAAGRLDAISDGLAAGILGAYAVCNDPTQKSKYNVRAPDGALVFSPGLWDRWAAEQACAAINAQRGHGEQDDD